MDGCDISNQLTGGFLPSPPPPQQLKETHNFFCSCKQTKETMVIVEIKQIQTLSQFFTILIYANYQYP